MFPTRSSRDAPALLAAAFHICNVFETASATVETDSNLAYFEVTSWLRSWYPRRWPYPLEPFLLRLLCCELSPEEATQCKHLRCLCTSRQTRRTDILTDRCSCKLMCACVFSSASHGFISFGVGGQVTRPTPGSVVFQLEEVEYVLPRATSFLIERSSEFHEFFLSSHDSHCCDVALLLPLSRSPTLTRQLRTHPRTSCDACGQ